MAIKAVNGLPAPRFWWALVFVVALAPYATSLSNGFVWDDEPIIVKNVQNRDPGALLEILTGMDATRAADKTPYYRPLTRLTYWVEYQVHGLNPIFSHLANMLLHAASAVLVLRLALALFGTQFPALAAALLFAVHPVNAEAVNFLATRNTLLSTLFVLAALVCFLGFLETGRRTQLGWCAAFFFLGVLSKETALCLVPLLPVTAAVLSGKPQRNALRDSLPGVLVCSALAGLYLVLRQHALSGAGASPDILTGLGDRLIEMLYLVPRSLLLLLWPRVLSPYYPLPQTLVPLIPWLALSWAGIIALVAWIATRGRCAATVLGLCWYAAFYLPASGIVPIPSAPLAERYLYLPAIGAWLIAAELLRRALERFPARKRAITGACTVLLILLAARSTLRTMDWRSNVTLFSRLVQTAPQLAFSHHNLGTSYLDEQQDPVRAQAELEQALRIDPSFPRSHTVLGFICMQRQDLAGANEHLSKALEQDPNDAEAHYNRAVIMEVQGKTRETLWHLERFLAIDNPEFAANRADAQAKVARLKAQPGG
jgi:protein O-mannosyl-transferase